MSIFPENLCNEFKNFLLNLNNLFPNNEVIINVNNESAESKIMRIQNLLKTLNSTTNFNSFLKCKIKVFSHKDSDTTKISESIFGKNLSLKKIFNNQTDEIKEQLWTNLHKLLLIYLEEEVKTDPSLSDKLTKIKESMFIKNLNLDQTKKSLQNIFQTDKLNNTTNNMINDIFTSFENVMSGQNTMENILNLSNELTHKYEEKINNGEIDLNGLLDGLKNNIPGMDGMKNILDPLLKMDGLMGQKEKEKEPVIIDENFSTSDITLGVEEENSIPNIGNMLKAVDNTGLLGMISGEQSNTFGKLLDVVNKLKDTGLENRDAINDILKNDLGLDVDKINKEMTSLLNKDSIIEE
jgi:hypothetical protein